MRTKLFTFVLTMALIIMVIPPFAYGESTSWEGQVGTKFAAGTGTMEDPYQISNPEELAYCSYMVESSNDKYGDKHYILTNHITLNEASNKSQPNMWRPIGNKGNPFKGNFNGNGFTIKNLCINSPVLYDQGLFGRTEGTADKPAIIKNLGLVNVEILGKNDVAAVIGYAKYTNIFNVYGTGQVTANYDCGGIAGTAVKSNITNAYSKVAVNTYGNFSGGIFGYCEDTIISNVYNLGLIQGKIKGGLVGEMEEVDSLTAIINSYTLEGAVGQSGENQYVGSVSEGYPYPPPTVAVGKLVGRNIEGKALISMSGTFKSPAEKLTLAQQEEVGINNNIKGIHWYDANLETSLNNWVKENTNKEFYWWKKDKGNDDYPIFTKEEPKQPIIVGPSSQNDFIIFYYAYVTTQKMDIYSAKALKDKKIKIVWAPLDEATHYNIYAKTSKGGKYKKIGKAEDDRWVGKVKGAKAEKYVYIKIKPYYDLFNEYGEISTTIKLKIKK